MKNLCLLIGRIGQHPTYKKFEDGKAVAEFSLATNERYKDKFGERQEITDWHKVKVWGKLADIVNEYCYKGQLVSVSGKVKTRSYDKNGETRYVTFIQCDDLQMLTKQDTQLDSPKSPAPDTTTASDDDDLPF